MILISRILEQIYIQTHLRSVYCYGMLEITYSEEEHLKLSNVGKGNFYGTKSFSYKVLANDRRINSIFLKHNMGILC